MSLSVSGDVPATCQNGGGDDGNVQLGRLHAVEGHLPEGKLGQGGLAGNEAGHTRRRIHRRVRAKPPAEGGLQGSAEAKAPF